MRRTSALSIQNREIKKYKHLCGVLHDALAEYADPDFYFAIAVMADRPAGGFADDFDRKHGNSFYDREMPGKLARQVLKKVSNQYGDLAMYTRRKPEE
jgi:hypothetical protein